MEIRPARDADYAAFTQLFPELRVDDPTPSVETWRAKMLATTLVADDGGEAIGYLYFDAFAEEGHVRHVAVAPAYHGKRIGQRLMERAAELMRARGLTRWALNVKPDNASAIRLYERMGLRPTFTSQALRFDWELTERLPAAPGLIAFRIEPARDADVEAAMKLSPGQLATARLVHDNVLVAVEDMRTIVAAGVFAPGFPGAYPFRAASPSAARGLLEALRPHARAEPPYMQVVVEGQPELAAAMREAGALLRLDIVHYEGQLAG